MLFFYFSTLLRILLAESETYTAVLTIENLQENCAISSELDNTTFSINKFYKLVLKFRIDDKSDIHINVDDEYVKISELKGSCSIEGYDYNGKLLSLLRLFEKKDLVIIFKGSPKASFRFRCQKRLRCLSSLDGKSGRINVLGTNAFSDDFFSKIFFDQKPNSITTINRQNNNYVLTNNYYENPKKCFNNEEEFSTNQNVQIVKTKQIEFTTDKDLRISFLNCEDYEQKSDV
ncbi:putative SP-containing protein [Vairimorpha necatrix]|uniref:SP-containing protein n=1 Tax=Vairimorpha necatrix TaxID=6039 RepID=A0AAX4J8Y4_9MICR